MVQGAPGSSGYFCVSWHPEVRQLDADVSADGGAARFGNDDGYIFGPPATVFAALARFEQRIYERCFLALQRKKTEVFNWGELPPDTPEDLKRAGSMVDGVFQPGMECYGVSIGTDRFVADWINKKVAEIIQVVDKTCGLLENDLQAKWTLLTSSVSQKLSYSLGLQYPSDIQAAAAHLDTALWGMMEKSTGLHIPRGEEGRGVECVLDVPIRALGGQAFQSWLVRLPVREKGMGL